MILLETRIILVLVLSLVFLFSCSPNFKKSENKYYIDTESNDFILYEIDDNGTKAYNLTDSTIMSYKNYKSSIDRNSLKKIDIGNVDISCLNSLNRFWCYKNDEKQICNKFFVDKDFLLNYGSQISNNGLNNPVVPRKIRFLNYFNKFYLISISDISQTKVLLTNLTEDTLKWRNIDNPEFVIINTHEVFNNNKIIGEWKIVSINYDDTFLKIGTEVNIDGDRIQVKNPNNKPELLPYFIGSNSNHIYYYKNDLLDMLFISEVGTSTFKLQRAYTDDTIELSKG